MDNHFKNSRGFSFHSHFLVAYSSYELLLYPHFSRFHSNE